MCDTQSVCGSADWCHERVSVACRAVKQGSNKHSETRQSRLHILGSSHRMASSSLSSPCLNASILLTLRDHDAPIRTIVAHPFVPIVAAGKHSGRIHVWDTETGVLLFVLEGHQGGVSGLEFDPSGRRLASSSSDQTVRIWDLYSGVCVCTTPAHTDWIVSVSWNATGSRVAGGTSDDKILIWDADVGALQRTLEGHRSWVLKLVTHATLDRFASADGEGEVRVWCWSTGTCLHVLRGHTGLVWAMAASPDWLVSVSVDDTMRVWSWTSDTCVRVVHEPEETFGVDTLAWDHSALAVVSKKEPGSPGTVHVWDTSSAADPLEWTRTGSLPLHAFHPHGIAWTTTRHIVCGAPDRYTNLAVWKLS